MGIYRFTARNIIKIKLEQNSVGQLISSKPFRALNIYVA